jgi:hypothetical protein
MSESTVTIYQATWMIVDQICPVAQSTKDERRTIADKVRKRIENQPRTKRPPFQITRGRIDASAFLPWARKTYPGFRPPAPLTIPLAASASIGVSADANLLGLPAVRAKALRSALNEALGREDALRRELKTAKAHIQELEHQLRVCEEARRRRSEAGRDSASRKRGL